MVYGADTHPDAPFKAEAFDLVEIVLKVGQRPRQGPDLFDEVSLSARLRWRRLAAYRPAPLKRAAGLEAALDDWPAPPDPQAYYTT
jgi:hypothetical protein